MAKPGLFRQFFNSEKAGGLILILCTLVSLLLANVPAATGYVHFWHADAGIKLWSIQFPFRVEEWINDGLMAIFFLMVGLEIKRELLTGELSKFSNAILPVIAAVGGMIVPASIHFLFNHGTAGQAGIGIPMATDIAFSLGVLSLLGKRVPFSLKIFLTALAIIDDLGAVLVIALFYTRSFSFLFLMLALALFIILLLLGRLRRSFLWIYLPAGLVLWYFLYRSGIHPTLSGILLAFAMPSGRGSNTAASARLQHALHKPVNFFIVPLFALANTAIHLSSGWHSDLLHRNSLGIAFGLILGKPLGIAGFTLLAVAMGIGRLPPGMNKWNLAALGQLAGIGFTMSIFISNLAFISSPDEIRHSKIAILLASLTAAILGFLFLKKTTRKDPLSALT
jgi:NhaA family Na+:H+ antiporter